MNLTKEQIEIINSTGNIKINAVAGSGKTTTVIEYAKSRPAQSRILYLAFNRSVRLEAMKKFAEKGLHHVQVETAHSLAYKHIVRSGNYTVSNKGYKTYEIAEILGLRMSGEKHAEYIVANHINKFIAYFCNSDKPKVQNLNYLEVVSEGKAKIFVTKAYEYIQMMARTFLAKMDSGEIDITHDFYLKKFQLSQPVLHYDYILFDEGQDASPAMLDVFLRQKATKVIVGDTHQQIYGWRFAVNSLEKADFKNYFLSTSFRFGQDIAKLAMEALYLKEYLGGKPEFTITGQGKHNEVKTKAVIGRTNLGLLLKAIEYVTEKKKVNHIYFEGNINSYTYAEEGASLYDVLNLYNQNRRMIKDSLIKKMRDMAELEDYIEKTEDVQLGMLVEIVKEYGNEIPRIIKEIKEKHVEGDEKDKAEVVFSTVHRCKGMEYDAIHLVDDFITEEKLDKLANEHKGDATALARLNEEVNLLYVAITRAKSTIFIPEAMMPLDFPASPHIKILKKPVEPEKSVKKTNTPAQMKVTKTFTVDGVRAAHGQAYSPWTDGQDEELTVMYCSGKSVKEMSEQMGRTKGAILSRIKKLELEETYGG